MFSTVGHDQHKARRAALNRFFSMVSVRRLQPVVEERVQRLIERFRGFKDADGEVMKIDYAFAAFTNGGLLSFRPPIEIPEGFLADQSARCCHGILLWSF